MFHMLKSNNSDKMHLIQNIQKQWVHAKVLQYGYKLVKPKTNITLELNNNILMHSKFVKKLQEENMKLWIIMEHKTQLMSLFAWVPVV